jgi:hemoglobin
MRNFRLALCAAVLAAGCNIVLAADDDLYRALGEKAGLQRLSADFVVRLKADAQIGHQFKDIKAAALAESLASQLCKVSGGPCEYEGATMQQAHKELPIHRADFNRLVEVLQDTMDAQGIAFGNQNRLLALLAPMHRDIIKR